MFKNGLVWKRIVTGFVAVSLDSVGLVMFFYGESVAEVILGGCLVFVGFVIFVLDTMRSVVEK